MEKEILIVDDETEFADYLRRGLTYAGYRVHLAHTAEDGLTKFYQCQPHFIILDVMLPGMDGMAVCRRVRESGYTGPVLMLTARNAIPDRVMGLDAGADDYLVKPFAFDELLARLRTLQRRTGDVDSKMTFADVELDKNLYTVRRAGKPKDAAQRYLDSLRAWASLGEDKDLPRTIVAERRLDLGRALWWLGDPGKAVDEVLKAVDADPDSPEIGASAVAFLIVAGRYRDALDAYHRGLGEPGGSELFKVYTSLWIVGEARRLGMPRDRLATEYLASRRGDLWYEHLARAASGTLSVETLRVEATTGPRRSELAFYSAVLGLDPAAATPEGRRKLLQQAVDARIVLDAEYDLARWYLTQP